MFNLFASYNLSTKPP